MKATTKSLSVMKSLVMMAPWHSLLTIYHGGLLIPVDPMVNQALMFVHDAGKLLKKTAVARA